MRLPFITKIKKLEEEQKKLQIHVSELIHFTQNVMEEHGKVVLNEFGPGNNTYDVGGRIFEFNKFSLEHRGFFIDGKKVSLTEFIKEAQKSETYLSKLQKLIRRK